MPFRAPIDAENPSRFQISFRVELRRLSAPGHATNWRASRNGLSRSFQGEVPEVPSRPSFPTLGGEATSALDPQQLIIHSIIESFRVPF